jgi:hypothetical protein
MKKIAIAVLVGFLMAPAISQAWDGALVTCLPTEDIKFDVEWNPEFTGEMSAKKFKTAAVFDGCDDNDTAPWGNWATANKLAKTKALTSTIKAVDIKIKGVTYSNCNLSGTPWSIGASATLKFAFLTAALDGDKVASGSSYGRVGAVTTPAPAVSFRGVVTKGFVTGAAAFAGLGLDLSDAGTAAVGACTALGGPSPTYPAAGVDVLKLITTTTSYFELFLGGESLCTGATTPFQCCTGVGVGCQL